MRHRLSGHALTLIFTVLACRPAAAATATSFPEPTPADTAYAALRESALASEKCTDAVRPVETSAPQPQYSASLRQQRAQGLVVLEGIIRSDGTIAYPRVLRADHPALAVPSLSVFKTYRYKPGTCGGKGVPRFVTITHTYRLE